MRVLMFGWEFPPRMSGGLGTACYGMTAALAGLGHRITFVLPQDGEAGAAPFLDLVSASGVPVSDNDRDDGMEALRIRIWSGWLVQTRYRSHTRKYFIKGSDILLKKLKYRQKLYLIPTLRIFGKESSRKSPVIIFLSRQTIKAK